MYNSGCIIVPVCIIVAAVIIAGVWCLIKRKGRKKAHNMNRQPAINEVSGHCKGSNVLVCSLLGLFSNNVYIHILMLKEYW